MGLRTSREKIGISLGWNCQPAIKGVALKLRKKKSEGYQTCPFDLMMSNYPGILQCLEDDFKDFYDPLSLELGASELIRHKKYGFIFNHESPGHPEIKDKYYYTANGYEKFIERYQQRIANFRNYLKEGNVLFLISRYNSIPIELEALIKRKYPSLQFKIGCSLNAGKETEEAGVADMLKERLSAGKMSRFQRKKCSRVWNGRYLYLE